MEGDARVNLMLLGKSVVLLGGLSSLLVVTGLNWTGQLNLSLSEGGFSLLILLALVLVVLALRCALKSLACFAASFSATNRYREISFRFLLFNCYAWEDYDDWEELGFWTVPALALAILPMVLAALVPYVSYSTELVYGGTVQRMGDSGGLGGQVGSYEKLLTSIELMPNETRRVLSEEYRLQPRFFCKATEKASDRAGTYSSTVHVPPWPIMYSDLPSGDAGQRITVENVDAFTFNSTCSIQNAWPSTWNATRFRRVDSGSASGQVIRVGQLMESESQEPSAANGTLLFLQELIGPAFGNMYCLSRVQRAVLSVTWVVNATGYYVESCSDVVPQPFNQSYVDLSQVDIWLNLTVRNTHRFILQPVLNSEVSASRAEEGKVMFTLVHLVSWLYASSRDKDPTRDAASSQKTGTATYTVQPIYAYYRASGSVFVTILCAAVVFLVAIGVRFIPHGFHGGSITQLVYLSRNLNFSGWSKDLLFKQRGRESTRLMVVLDREHECFQMAKPRAADPDDHENCRENAQSGRSLAHVASLCEASNYSSSAVLSEGEA